MNNVSGILLMAGNSNRFNQDINKTLYQLNGKHLFVDYNTSATYGVSYSSSWTTGRHSSPTYNLNNLYGTAM